MNKQEMDEYALSKGFIKCTLDVVSALKVGDEVEVIFFGLKDSSGNPPSIRHKITKEAVGGWGMAASQEPDQTYSYSDTGGSYLVKFGSDMHLCYEWDQYIKPVQGYSSKKAAYPDGMRCSGKKCPEPHQPWAEPNRPDGTFLCYSCRNRGY